KEEKQGSLFISPAYAAEGGSLIPAIPFPADALRGINANIKLNIGEIIQDGKNIAGFSGTTAINDGNLNISPMKLLYAKNTFSGNIGLNGNGKTPALTVNLNSDNLNYGDLLKELKLNDRIRGTGALALSLSGSGNDLRQAMGASRGSLKVTSNSGEFETGILFDGIGNVLRLAIPGYNVPNIAHVRCANFIFTGQNGIWQTTNSAVDSDVLAMQMSGDVNLATEKLNLKAFPNMKAVKAGGLIPPIKIAGAITKPAVIVDGSGLAQSAVTAAVLGKTKGMDILRSLGTSGESAAPTTDASGNACLAAVQATAANNAPAATTQDAKEKIIQKLVPAEKQEEIKQDLQKGLQGLFGKKPAAAPAPVVTPEAAPATTPEAAPVN
ncbi:MAG TPA: AsmA-like C-terminal region-containing protein, partial [Alphaproteobacteria bacterium]|nr:AsmA-like C-terminal region-containing protein [Alphaproteobacteria bacterium]